MDRQTEKEPECENRTLALRSNSEQATGNTPCGTSTQFNLTHELVAGANDVTLLET
jgi:hypothetical protein